MINIKPKNLSLVVFALLGLVYFCAISNLGINPFLRSQVALIPIQLIAITYLTYLRWSRKQSVEL